MTKKRHVLYRVGGNNIELEENLRRILEDADMMADSERVITCLRESPSFNLAMLDGAKLRLGIRRKELEKKLAEVAAAEREVEAAEEVLEPET